MQSLINSDAIMDNTDQAVKRLQQSRKAASKRILAEFAITASAHISIGKKSASLLLLSTVLLTLSGCDALWNKDQPQNIEYQVHISAPSIPSLQANTPSALQVDFSIDQEILEQRIERAETNNEYQQVLPAHALKLSSNNATLNDKITITPHVNGVWTVVNDSLVFNPDLHWPANVSYSLQFSDELFMKNVALSQKEYLFTTKGLNVNVTNSRLYVDPTKPDEHRYVSTLLFTHPIDPIVLKEQYTLSLASGASGKNEIAYTLTEDQQKYNQSQRLFYINSEQIEIGPETRYLNATLPNKFKEHVDSKTSTTTQRITSEPMISEKVRIPSADDIFHVAETSVQIVSNEDNEPQQSMVLRFSSSTTLAQIRQHLKIGLMPVRLKNNRRIQWNSASEITPEIASTISDIQYSVLPTAEPFSELFSLLFAAPDDRQVLLHINKGMTSTAGYTTARNFSELHHAPQYPVELAFLGEGSVLDSNGSHEVGFVGRNLTDLEVRVGRVSQNDLHHLIGQTGGNFKDVLLQRSLSIEDLAVITKKKMKLNNSNPAKQNYSSYDLSKYLTIANEPTGVFHVEAIGRNENNHATVRTTRTILVTDIGFIAKNNSDGSRDVFVQKISTQTPLSNAHIVVLGRNGRAVFEIDTDERGHALIPNLNALRDEKQPVALVVTKDTDLAYLPMHNSNRELNLSRFDTGGRYISANEQASLSALVFSDRGIYRPGESVKLAAIVRDGSANSTEQFKVRMIISDPRGTTVYQQSHLLPEDGFIEANLDTTREYNTGVYNAQLTISDGQYKNRHLGSIEFSVEEFQPDRLKISSDLSDRVRDARTDVNARNSSIKGWLTNDELEFQVSVNNLFGTPAQDRKVSANYQLNWSTFAFADHPGYSFSDVVTQQARHALQNRPELSVANTDVNGKSDIQIALAEYFGGTYRIQLSTQGFEQNGGRSVHTENTVRFSPRDYLIGHKSSDLNYLKQNDSHKIDFQCVDKFTQSISCPMQLNIVEINTVSTLVKQNNGTYQYQSIEKKIEHSNTPIVIASAGYSHSIDTAAVGDYVLELIDERGETRKSIAYRVIGEKNTAAKLDKDARLELSLDKAEYAEGDWINLQIKAPYTGSGLISIESDHTHAFAWFKANSTQSTQKIQVPKGLIGNAYVQVAFVRAPSSKEVFTAPLSYAIAPFSLSKSKYKMALTVNTPTTAKPGEKFKITYKSSHPGRSLIFAVDEGILQVADYTNPDPLAFFLQKRALQVQTQQMFDLLLPEFALLKELSASGGGMAESADSIAGSNLNPFAREVRDPVAFWSGIVPTDQTERSIEFDIPDHFDGTIRVISIALNENRFAKATSKVIVKGPFVVTPNLPLVVAPGDTFIATVGVSNQIENSSNNAKVALSIDAGKYFDVIGESTQTYNIREGDEHTFKYTLKAKTKLGSADIRFSAKTELGGKANHSRDSSSAVSVRPATLLQNTIVSGKTERASSIISAERSMISDMSDVTMTVSAKPSLLINGLIGYLQAFQHACTEQIVSQLSPVLTFLDHPNILGTPQQKYEKIDRLFSTLRSRQLPNGGFTLWPGGAYAADVPSVHALHTLLDTQEQGIKVPGPMLENGVRYLKEFSYDPESMQKKPELAAYALYLLTRRGELTNNALIQLQSILDEAQKRKTKNSPLWQEQLVAAYMAASFKILRRDEDADSLIVRYKFKKSRTNIDQYDSSLYRDAMVVYLIARHFKDEINKNNVNRIEAIVDPIFNGSINTLSAGRALIALKAIGDLTDDSAMNVTMETTQSASLVAKDDQTQNDKTQWQEVNVDRISSTTLGYFAQLDNAVTALKITNDVPAYFQLQQTGFDLNPPTSIKSEGLEISKQILEMDGNPLERSPSQGDDVLIRVTVRSSDNRVHQAIAVVDLLPGGFEIDRQSIRDYQNYQVDYLDIREDRLVVYTAIGPRPTTITYKARITTSGEFTVPAAYANAMYDERVNAHSASSKMMVQAQQ